MDPEHDNEASRPKFEDIKLTVGWKVVNQTVMENTNAEKKRPNKEIIVNWEERTVEESLSDCCMFANDLASALESRLESCVNAKSSSFFDIGEIFKLLCGKRLPDGRVKVQEGDLEEYAMEDFREFFKEVCSLEHVKQLNDETFDPRLHSRVLSSFKQALRILVWDQGLKQALISCFTVVYFAGKQPVKAQLHEEEVVKALYTNELLYADSGAGQVAMTALDVALAMGGPVKSYRFS